MDDLEYFFYQAAKHYAGNDTIARSIAKANAESVSEGHVDGCYVFQGGYCTCSKSGYIGKHRQEAK